MSASDDAPRLLAAIEAGDIEAARAAVASDPALARARDGQGVSVIQHAVYRRRPEILEALLSADPELDVFEAALLGDLVQLAARLEEQPGRLSAHSADGFTPLHLAAFAGQPDTTAALLERGADTAARTTNAMANQPLHAAAVAADAAARSECSRLLLEAGADATATQAGGYTPLHAAAQLGDDVLAELLLAHGAQRTADSEDGRTPAVVAREAGHAGLASILEG